jgi:hypothetical protein
MKPRSRIPRTFVALFATCLAAMTFAGTTAAADSRAKVVSVELHRSLDGDRTVLLLEVRNFQSGHGEAVEVSRGDVLDSEVFARSVRGSPRRWRVGPKTTEGRDLLAELHDSLETKGVARVDAGVLASGPSGGKLSHFRIRDFDEPAPALGALTH